jgi:hypothetical protein
MTGNAYPFGSEPIRTLRAHPRPTAFRLGFQGTSPQIGQISPFPMAPGQEVSHVPQPLCADLSDVGLKPLNKDFPYEC